MTLSRREFVKKSSLTLSFAIAGSSLLLSPEQAYAKKLPFSNLTAKEVDVLEAVCELLLPGAKQAGVAHFVDHQLGEDPNDCLLALKYFNYPPPFADFYRAVLSAMSALSQTMYGKEVSALNEDEGEKFIEAIRDKNPQGWQAPPAPLAYIAIRNDAVDVVYGTPEGFEKLGVPYMEHILPPEGWS